MRMSSPLMAAVFVASLSACSGSPMGTNFSGIPPMPEQQTQNAADPSSQKVAQFPADPPVQLQFNHAQTSPYDSPDFVVPPYEIEP